MSFFSWLFGEKYDINVEILSYDPTIDSWKLTITSSKDCTLESISYLISSDNDMNDWIMWFYDDYNRFYDEEETLGIYSNLMAWIPITLNFSSKVLKEFTLKNVEKYIEDVSKDPDLVFEEDWETCIDSFMNPEWNMVISIGWVEVGSAEIPYENTEISEYMKNL